MAALGVVSLIAFAFALTRVDSAFAGRAYAAYRRDLHCSVAGLVLADRGTSAHAHRPVGSRAGDLGSPDHHRLRRAGAPIVLHEPEARPAPVRPLALVIASFGSGSNS